jgi:4a-hydroxytetrahydrobiopterin dehydratase
MQKQKLSLNLKLESFMEVIDLTKQIANIAESESHHPNLKIHSYNRLDIEIYTHEIDGISNKDILLAQKIDELIS